jgi:phosphoserine phosphatase RsbU/P
MKSLLLILIFLFASVLIVVGTSVWMYHDHNHEHSELAGEKRLARDDVVIDAYKTFNSSSRERVICYRESHRNFYIFVLELILVIVALTVYGIITKVRLSRQLSSRNEEIEAKNAEIISKNLSILSSIRYAKRIQIGQSPTQARLEKSFKAGFSLLSPRDEVSGDFFFLGESGTKQVLAVADCTGHGVPGAFIALLGSRLLHEIVEKDGITSPDLILTQLDFLLSQAIPADPSAGYTSDSMEISILVKDTASNELCYAGAGGYALIIDSNNGTVSQFKGTRYTLGQGNSPIFETHTFPNTSGTTYYLYTDGYPDQFGGPNAKKLSRNGFRNLLQQASQLPISAQQAFLKKELLAWQGSNAQVDDILVVGVQPFPANGTSQKLASDLTVDASPY